MATAQANAAAPLDQLLVDVGAGPLRRWLPSPPASSSSPAWPANLVRSAGALSSRVEISLTKSGKDLVTMSETPITQQAEAAVTRINQLTERMLTAARNAGGDLAVSTSRSSPGPAPPARVRSTRTSKPCRIWPTSKPRSRAAASLTGCKLSPARTPNS
jgi:hypothetical protein